MRWLGNFAVLFVATAISIGVAEWVLSVRASRTEVIRDGKTKHHFAVYRPDPLLSHALKPSWSGVQESYEFSARISTDDLGHRTTVHPPAASTGAARRRILVIGDSFAFGWGVHDHETFASVLADRLAEKGPVEVINAGVPGYSADQHLIYLRTRGFALEPDLLLVAVCGNDDDELAWKDFELGPDKLPARVQSRVRMITPRGKMRFENDGLLKIPTFRFAGDDWWIEHSALYNFARFGLMRTFVAFAEHRAQPESTTGVDPEADLEELSPETIEDGLAASERFRTTYHERLMRAIEAEARARGIPFRMVYIEGVTPQFDCEPRVCLDQGTLFSHADGDGTYYEIDRHWTAEGHRIVGEALATWLPER